MAIINCCKEFLVHQELGTLFLVSFSPVLDAEKLDSIFLSIKDGPVITDAPAVVSVCLVR